MKNEFELIFYEMTIPEMNLELYKKSELYDLFKLLMHFKALKESCIVKKFNKPTKTGTKIRFEKIEFKKAVEITNNAIEEYNNKYNTKLEQIIIKEPSCN